MSFHKKFIPTGKKYGILKKTYAGLLASERGMNMTIGEALANLQKSDFRSRFHLTEKDKAYISAKGLPVIRQHAADFVRKRLSPAEIPNDGKQTPMQGHPVFVAQHACACCCRGCLEKWYKIPKGVELSDIQQEGIVNLLMAWILREVK